MDTTDLKE